MTQLSWLTFFGWDAFIASRTDESITELSLTRCSKVLVLSGGSRGMALGELAPPPEKNFLESFEGKKEKKILKNYILQNFC